MFKFKKVIGLATLVAIVAALGISSAAMAQSTTTPTPAAPTAPTAPVAPDGQRGPGGRELHSQAALDAAAKALGMTSTDLQAQLWGGKTLADIATAQKVDIATVQAAVLAAEKAEAKTQIAAAVTAGTITQAKADWLISGLDKGYWGPGVQGGIGFGMDGGMGRGGHGGRGGFGGANGGVPNSNNTTPTTPSTGTSSGTAF